MAVKDLATWMVWDGQRATLDIPDGELVQIGRLEEKVVVGNGKRFVVRMAVNTVVATVEEGRARETKAEADKLVAIFDASPQIPPKG